MIDIKVNFEDGDCVYTRMNATPDEAREFYVGHRFNVRLGPEDNLKKCMSIEILKEEV